MKLIVRSLLLYLVLHSSTYAIVGGTASGISEYDSVGSIANFTATGIGIGSFVAISPSWVLTAAHVVDVPGTLILTVGVGAAEVNYIGESAIFHPAYDVGEFHDDLALVKVFLEDIMPSVHPTSFATLSNVPLIPSSIIPTTTTISGWGQESVLGDPPDAFSRHHVSSNTYIGDPFATAGFPPPPLSPPADPFDFPTDCGGGSILCTYDATGGAPGDSGGAMFLDVTEDGIDNPVVAAINSFVFDELDLDGIEATEADFMGNYWTVGTSIAPYESWIRSIVEASGETVNFGSASPVPLPPALYLFGAGLLGVAGMSRRRAS